MEQQLNTIAETLSRTEELLKIVVRQMLQETLDRELHDHNLRLLFEQTGSLAQDELVKSTGISAGKISNLWQRWESMGLLVKDGRRYKKRF